VYGYDLQTLYITSLVLAVDHRSTTDADIAHNTISFEKVMCCDKLATTQYFLKK